MGRWVSRNDSGERNCIFIFYIYIYFIFIFCKAQLNNCIDSILWCYVNKNYDYYMFLNCAFTVAVNSMVGSVWLAN